MINPQTKIDGIYDILIEENKIIELSESISEKADRVIDATDRFVMPGFIDLHVHLREPGYEYKETISTGSKAAARGGFTSICPMPNTNPAIDNKAMIEYLLLKAKQESLVNILPIGAITKGQNGDMLADIKEMVQAGAVALSEDGKSVMDTSVYRKAMKLAKECNVPIFAHCEDRSLVENGVMNAGKKAEELGLLGITNAVEDVIVARDILMAKESGVRLHLCHCSTADSVVLVKMAKEQGLPVSAEVCPHHFTMSEDEIECDDGNYKMNPPLRSSFDVQALKEALRDGIMDVIATDHAPHGEEEKKQSIKVAPFGIVGLETAFALTMTELVGKGYLTPTQMVEKLSTNPAKVLGIDRGSLAVGKIADLVIADPNAVYQIEASSFASKGKNTPFNGKEVTGRIEMTIVGGNIVYEMKN